MAASVSADGRGSEEGHTRVRATQDAAGSGDPGAGGFGGRSPPLFETVSPEAGGGGCGWGGFGPPQTPPVFSVPKPLVLLKQEKRLTLELGRDGI